MVPAESRRRNVLKLLKRAAYNHNQYEVFADWIACSALAISNAVDWSQKEEREKEYARIQAKYRAEDFELFPQMFAELTYALEEREHDALGAIFGELEIHNKDAGQFFTPAGVTDLMASLISDFDTLVDAIHAKGYVTIQEPAVGAGAHVISMAKNMRKLGFNYQRQMHCVAIDIDRRCVHMAYLQFSLLGIPAVIYEGNTLSMKMRNVWYTPQHILGGWGYKLNKSQESQTETISPELAAEILQI
jgi:hypothetical protein